MVIFEIHTQDLLVQHKLFMLWITGNFHSVYSNVSVKNSLAYTIWHLLGCSYMESSTGNSGIFSHNVLESLIAKTLTLKIVIR